MGLLGDADSQANFALAAGLLGGGNFGQAFGRGLMGYQATLNHAADRKVQEAYRQAQMQQMQQQLEDRQRAAAQAKAQQRYLQSQQALTGSNVNASTGIVGPTPAAASQIGQRPQIDPIEAIRYLGPEGAKMLIESGNWGRPKVERTAETENGIQQLDAYGQPVGAPLPRYVAPQLIDTGGRKQFVIPQAGQAFDVTMSPEQKDASARGWANVGVARGNLALSGQRLAFDQGAATTDAGGPSQAALVKQFGKPEAGRRWLPNGDQELIPGGSADLKSAQQREGAATFNQIIAELRGYYDTLEKGGGITSTGNGMLSNIGAATSSSSVGQALGRAVGTDNQSARNSIMVTRPRLLQAMMKATGMSSKQMDSNAELKLYLSTATDPTLDIQTNRKALDSLEQNFGGAALPKQDTPELPRVKSIAEAQFLKPGTRFVDPNGVERVR